MSQGDPRLFSSRLAHHGLPSAKRQQMIKLETWLAAKLSALQTHLCKVSLPGKPVRDILCYKDPE